MCIQKHKVLNYSKSQSTQYTSIFALFSAKKMHLTMPHIINHVYPITAPESILEAFNDHLVIKNNASISLYVFLVEKGPFGKHKQPTVSH